MTQMNNDNDVSNGSIINPPGPSKYPIPQSAISGNNVHHVSHSHNSPHLSQVELPRSPQHSQMYVPYNQPSNQSMVLQQQGQQSNSQLDQSSNNQVQYLPQQNSNTQRRIPQNQYNQAPSSSQQQQVVRNQSSMQQNPNYQMYPNSQPNQHPSQQFLMQQQNRESSSPLNLKQQHVRPGPQQKVLPNKRQRLDSDNVSPASVNTYSASLQQQPQHQSQSQIQNQTPGSVTDSQTPYIAQPHSDVLVQQPQQKPLQSQFSSSNGYQHPAGKKQFPTDGVKEYGESLRILETDNRKKMQHRNSQDHSTNGGNAALNFGFSSLGNNNNPNSSKIEPGSQFAEFSNMLGQLQQNVSSSVNANSNSTNPTINNISPANAVSPSMKSPMTRKTTAPSTAAPTPLANGLPNGITPVNGNVTGVANTANVVTAANGNNNNNNNKKKKVTRKPRKNSTTSVPATPKTPSHPATPSASSNNTNTRRGGRRKATSTANTPVIKEDGNKLKTVNETSKPDVDNKAPYDNKKRKSKVPSGNSKNSNDKPNDDSTQISSANPKSSSVPSGVNSKAVSHGIETRNPSAAGFNINPDAQFLGDFNGSELFDFGLYPTDDAPDILPEFWNDAVDRPEL